MAGKKIALALESLLGSVGIIEFIAIQYDMMGKKRVGGTSYVMC